MQEPQDDTPQEELAAAGTYQNTNQQASYGQTIGERNIITNAFYPPPVEKEPPPSRAWNVPYARNPFFTGREELLSELRTHLLAQHSSAIGQAISGLGGIGKTQLAVEYAHRHADDYPFVLWIHAENQESLIASYSEVAALLKLPERTEPDQAVLIQAIKTWLHTQQDWLLIFDNADEPALLRPFLPTRLTGHLLLTTRAADISSLELGFAQPLQVQRFSPEDGVLFLLRRLRGDASHEPTTLSEWPLARQVSLELDGLPLALTQASAYMLATQIDLAAYLHLYQQHHLRLFQHHPHQDPTQKTVLTTWSLSFERIEAQSRTAADLLRLCAFLASDAIPEVILTTGAAQQGRSLALLANPLEFNAAIDLLSRYSLLQRDPATTTLSLHRLVQAVLRSRLSAAQIRTWQRHTLYAIYAARPNPQDATQWPFCEQWLPHALHRLSTPDPRHADLVTSSLLSSEAGLYLNLRGRYPEAEPLLLRALAIYEQHLGPEHPDTATSLNSLATLYRNQGRYPEAEPLYLRALAICEQHLGPEHPDTALNFNYLALLYQNQGRYSEAEPLLLRALAIDEQHLGPEHPDTASSLNNLAMLYQDQCRSPEAEPLLLRALAICEQHLGSEHPDTAGSLSNLAMLYRNQGRYSEAEPLLRRALAIREQHLGPKHPDTNIIRRNYVILLQLLKTDQETPDDPPHNA
jgi:tetratricopeptide (TPR) repeat protein